MPQNRQFRGLMPYIFLVFAGIVAGYGVVFAANPVAQARGDSRTQELVCMMLTGLLGFAYWLWRRRAVRAHRLGSGLDWMVLLPPSYALFQAVALPLSAIRVLSPARARLVDALGAVMAPPRWAPLSVTPAATMFHCLLFATCVVFFLIIYDLAAKLAGRVWLIVLPLVIFAAAEAALGLAQMSANPEGVATGTYGIRNHYAGLLEMVLPFAVLYPIAVFGRARSRERGEVRPYLLACSGWGIAAVIMAGVLVSLSRMGFLSMLMSMVFIALVALLRRHAWRRNAFVLGAISAGALAVVVLLPPVRLILRFEDMDKGSSESREVVWRASLPLVAEYPLFGCGLGGYGSAFPAFKTSGPTLIQDYAHNDYVQYAAELGIVGFTAFAMPIAIILSRLRRAWQDSPQDIRWLALACAGSAMAIGLHSFADFNLYVPANMITFAWVLGVAAHAGHPRARCELLVPEDDGLRAGSNQ